MPKGAGAAGRVLGHGVLAGAPLPSSVPVQCLIRASLAPIPVLSLPLPVAECPIVGSAAVGSWLEAQDCAGGSPCSLASPRTGSPQGRHLLVMQRAVGGCAEL